MLPGLATVKRKVRSGVGRLLKQIGLLPGGVPNRLGEEKHWRNRRLHGEVLVFFPDTPGGLYQLRAWYGPLERLHLTQGVTIVCMDSRTARAIRSEVRLPVLTISQESFLDELIQRSTVKLFLYVNFTQANFLALRIRSVIHIYLTHGDSDKTVSVSNQTKAFDFCFVAGQAAIDRFKKYTPLFDAESRCIAVGRPQLDTDFAPSSEVCDHGEMPTVLYAPTWEGGHETLSYGSVASHGLSIVKSLIGAGFRVVYRPHPLIGQRVAKHGEADNEIRRYLKFLKSHEVSSGRTLAQDFEGADLLISDVSSVVNDWLVTGKPAMVTVSAVASTREASTNLLETVPRITVRDLARVGALAREQIEVDPSREYRLALRSYYLGDTTPGASVGRFLGACERLAELRDHEWARIIANEDHGSAS